jgi:hypothetical protein
MPRTRSRSLRLALTIAAAASLASASSAAAQGCGLEYQRADNMWAAFGRPDGGLGVESIALSIGQTKVFVTDWKYEKKRNDGSNYYGSHLRVFTNRGSRPVRLLLRGSSIADLLGSREGGIPVSEGIFTNVTVSSGWLTIYPGTRRETKADLVEVNCPPDSPKS